MEAVEGFGNLPHMADSCIFVAGSSDPVKSKQGFLSTGGSFKQTSLNLQSSPSSKTVQSWCSNGAQLQKTAETREERFRLIPLV